MGQIHRAEEIAFKMAKADRTDFGQAYILPERLLICL